MFSEGKTCVFKVAQKAAPRQPSALLVARALAVRLLLFALPGIGELQHLFMSQFLCFLLSLSFTSYLGSQRHKSCFFQSLLCTGPI